MTITAKDELADIVELCLEAISEQSKLEKSITTDYESLQRTIRELEGRRGSEPVTVEMGQALALHIRKVISESHLSAQGTHILLLLVLKISLLAQLDKGMDIETMPDAKKELESWFEQWEAAKEALDKYTE